MHKLHIVRTDRKHGIIHTAGHNLHQIAPIRRAAGHNSLSLSPSEQAKARKKQEEDENIKQQQT